MIRLHFICLFLMGCVAFGAGQSLAEGRPVRVFAASSLQGTLDDVAASYRAKTGQPVSLTFGASSALARQIENGAPADIFISADRDWMDYLADRGLIDPRQRINLLGNRLVLIAPEGSRLVLPIRPRMDLARALGGGRLALAGPDVPAGRYAQSALTSLGVWESVRGQLAPADSVRAALQFVARGEAPLGIVYETDARQEPQVRTVGVFPEATHPAIVYPAAPVTGGDQTIASRRFLQFLASPPALKTFREHGFSVPARVSGDKVHVGKAG